MSKTIKKIGEKVVMLESSKVLAKKTMDTLQIRVANLENRKGEQKNRVVVSCHCIIASF